MDFKHQEIEARCKALWEKNKTYRVENNSDKPKYYVLDMFPYPSGAGLHVGHPLGYIASDIYARFKRMKGFNVLHPMGYDAFGLPAEQYAIQTGVHPAVTTDDAILTYRRQMDNIGFSFDWSRQVKTNEPTYYRWTQEIFLMLFQSFYNKNTDLPESIESLIVVFEKEGNEKMNAANSQETIFTAAEWASFSNKQKDDVLMNYRLAYRKILYVNWCEALGTVLANDEIKDGLSERGGHPVIQKPMMQWVLRITAYAEKLLQGLEEVDFSEAIKTQQRNWIGRSEGAKVLFNIQNSNEQIEIFTTRPDTIFGASFMVLAPEHELVQSLVSDAQRTEIDKYLAYTNSRSERDRQTEKKVTGCFTGSYAINPFSEQPVPIYISKYVLAGYGTGAIMAVPGHDERDERFAKHFDLPIIKVLEQPEGASMEDKVGKMINSGFLNGLECKQAISTILQEIETRGIGVRKVNFRLRDANFSRQRYWGEPIPIKYDAEGAAHVEKNLPLELPTLKDYTPTADGKAPLARAAEWVNTPDGFTREIDTMPGFAGSSWYFLRYMDPNNAEAFASKEALNYWQDVDLYVGGSEHAVGHLLYSRFWHRFLHDLGYVPTKEPYKRLVNQGMIQGVIEYLCLKKEKNADGKHHFISADLTDRYTREEVAFLPVHIDFVKYEGEKYTYLDKEGIAKFIDWRSDYADAHFETNELGRMTTVSEVGKMSKRYFNVVNPDVVVAEFGADAFRLYEMFLGPVEDSKPWDTRNMKGTFRFVNRFWSLFFDKGEWIANDESEPTREELRALHACIKRVSEDIERFSFNTCVPQFMICTDELKRLNCRKKSVLETFLRLVAPFAPFVTEELWQQAGNSGSIHHAEYPTHNESYLTQDEFEYPLCINGKKRTTFVLPATTTQKDVEEFLATLDLTKWTDGKAVSKIIFVPKRMINLVV